MIVLDNVSIFADLIYQPATSARQSRIRIVASVSADWHGQLDAPGFILNQDNIQEWKANLKYARGEIVRYKNAYYSANVIVQPSAEFDFNEWSVSDYTKIQQGLLPNLSNNSNQLANSYNVYAANLEKDQDLFSYGLIGYRPRQYMSALNLDSTSQVNLYRQFLGTKGTVQAAEIFKFADLGRGAAQYDIFENWAVQRAVYGANANRSFYELQLNEALLQSNPSLIEVVQPEQSSTADQTVQLNNVWKESYKLTSTDILTTVYPIITDTALPSAGYVNIDDVDITVFDITDPAALSANIDSIGVGTTIWVAKVNDYDWNIYRSSQVPGVITQVNNNLDGTSVLTFSKAHGLTLNQTVIIRFFSAELDGVYRVVGIPSVQQIVIEFSFIASDQIVATGEGIAFILQTQRVAQSSDVLNLPYATSLLPGNKAWVDNNGSGHWEVLEKQEVFVDGGQIVANDPVANSNYGASIAQAADNLYTLVGCPDYSQGQNTGAVYTYVRTEASPYTQNSLLELDYAADTVGFGHALSIGYQSWQVVGAPASYNNRGYASTVYRTAGSASFTNATLLTVPDPRDLAYSAEFGYSVVVSKDENWMYVGAPGINKVFAYGLVNVEAQSKTYITDGLQFTYNFSDSVVIDAGQDLQVTVILNNELLTLGIDYTQTATNIVFIAPPAKGLVLRINRRTATTYLGDGSTRSFSLNEYLYSATTIDSFKVTVDGILQRPNIDYEFNADDSTQGRDLIFFTAPNNGSTIGVATQSYFTYVTNLRQ
jgi:hypothetical protein